MAFLVQWLLKYLALFFFFYYFLIISLVRWQTWVTFTKGCFLPGLVDIGPVVLESTEFTDDKVWSEKLMELSSSGEL